jgi:hypothetical protein
MACCVQPSQSAPQAGGCRTATAIRLFLRATISPVSHTPEETQHCILTGHQARPKPPGAVLCCLTAVQAKSPLEGGNPRLHCG